MGSVWRGLPRGGAGLAAVTRQSFVWFWFNLGCCRQERRSGAILSPLGTSGPLDGLGALWCGPGCSAPTAAPSGPWWHGCWGIASLARRDCGPRVPLCPGIRPPAHRCAVPRGLRNPFSGFSARPAAAPRPHRRGRGAAGSSLQGERAPVQQLLGRRWTELRAAALAAGLARGFLVAALLGASGGEEVGARSSAGFRIVPCERSSVPLPVRREASRRLLLCILLPSSCAARALSKLLIRE